MKRLLYSNKDSIFLVVGNGMSRFFLIVSSFVIIKLMGDETYSKYALIYSAILSIQIFLNFGLNAIVTKKIAQKVDVFDLMRKVSIILVVMFIFVSIGLYFFVYSDFVESFSYIKDVSYFIIIFSCLSYALYSITISMLYGFFEKIKVSKINIINGLLNLFFLSLFSYLGFFEFLFFGLLISNIVCILYAYLNFNNKVTRDLGLKTSLFDVIKESFPIFLSSILVAPIISVIYTIMNNYLNYKDIAIFSVSMQWYSVILFIPGVLANLVLAKFSLNSNNICMKSYIEQTLWNVLITVFVAIFVAILLFFILPYYGEYYIDNFKIFLLFILTTIFVSFSTVCGQLYISLGRQWIGFIFNLLWCFIILILIILSLRWGLGIMGVAGSFLISYVLHSIFQNLYIYQYLTCRAKENV